MTKSQEPPGYSMTLSQLNTQQFHDTVTGATWLSHDTVLSQLNTQQFHNTVTGATWLFHDTFTAEYPAVP